MNILQTEWWSIGVPQEWWAEQEDESIVSGDRDDVGCIEISTLQKESGQFGSEEVRSIASNNSEGDWSWQSLSAGDFKGYGTSYLDDSDAVREWYLACGPVLLFVTYCCDGENSGLDDAAVDEILATLTSLEDG